MKIIKQQYAIEIFVNEEDGIAIKQYKDNCDFDCVSFQPMYAELIIQAIRECFKEIETPDED